MAENMKHLLLTACLWLTVSAAAQQNVKFTESSIESPVVNADRSVTFTVAAPTPTLWLYTATGRLTEALPTW